MMSRAPVLLALALCLAAAPARPAAAGDEPAAGGGGRDALIADLRAACEKAKPADRAAAAEALARRPGATLAAWKEAIVAMRPVVPPAAGERAQTVTLHVLAADEATEIVTYVPRSLKVGESAPLVLAIHGSRGRGSEVLGLWRDVAESAGAIVVAPTEAGPNEGYRFSARERASALQALRWARLRFDVDPDRVLVTGESRGGHMSWDLALRHPDLWAAAAPMIGAPRLAFQGGQNNLRYLENAVDLTIRDLQGSKDDPRAVENLRVAFERLKAFGAKDAQLLEFPALGHEFEFGAVDWAKLLGSVRRDPDPRRVVLRAAARGDARSRWVEAVDLDASVQEAPEIAQPAGWSKMEESAQRKYVEAEVDKRTARIEVVRTAPGRFEAKAKGVTHARLLLTAEALGAETSVVVTWNGTAVTRKATPSASVLLKEFVERVDRAFLPVAEIVVP